MDINSRSPRTKVAIKLFRFSTISNDTAFFTRPQVQKIPQRIRNKWQEQVAKKSQWLSGLAESQHADLPPIITDNVGIVQQNEPISAGNVIGNLPIHGDALHQLHALTVEDFNFSHQTHEEKSFPLAQATHLNFALEKNTGP